MTQDEIIRMAREAGLAEWHESIQQHGFKFADVNNLERFAALVSAHEREACAKVCDDRADGAFHAAEFAGRNAVVAAEEATECAAAIRGRIEK